MATHTGLIDLVSKDTRVDLDWHERGEKRIKMKDLDSILKSGGMKKCSIISEHTEKVEDSNFRQTNHIKLSLGLDTVEFSTNQYGSQKPTPSSFCSDPNDKPFYPTRIDASECGSTTGPTNVRCSYNKKNEMKRRSHLSSSHGYIPSVPKYGDRQLKRRKEEDSRENIDLSRSKHPAKYARNSAPSGLLSGLNPGIIKHVRNSKQVNSIIEAMLKFEKSDGENKTGTKDAASHYTVGGVDLNSRTSYISKFEHGIKSNESYNLGKLSSDNLCSTVNTDWTSNTDLPASHDITSLSIKGAFIASQWLDILQQDIKGRLTALRRSRKKVNNVIQIELPYLTSKELMCDGTGSREAVLTLHREKWKSIFSQMELSLYEEGKNLENWLKQVRDMQSHCEGGLKFFSGDHASLLTEEFSDLKKADVLDRDNAVRAAAASINSTCNKIMMKGNINVPCF